MSEESAPPSQTGLRIGTTDCSACWSKKPTTPTAYRASASREYHGFPTKTNLRSQRWSVRRKATRCWRSDETSREPVRREDPRQRGIRKFSPSACMSCSASTVPFSNHDRTAPPDQTLGEFARVFSVQALCRLTRDRKRKWISLIEKGLMFAVNHRRGPDVLPTRLYMPVEATALVRCKVREQASAAAAHPTLAHDQQTRVDCNEGSRQNFQLTIEYVTALARSLEANSRLGSDWLGSRRRVSSETAFFRRRKENALRGSTNRW